LRPLFYSSLELLVRTPDPLPGLQAGPYELSLARVTLPPGMPADRSHFRSGAALNYVLAGRGPSPPKGRPRLPPRGLACLPLGARELPCLRDTRRSFQTRRCCKAGPATRGSCRSNGSCGVKDAERGARPRSTWNYGLGIEHERGNIAGAGPEPWAAAATGATRVRGQWSSPVGVWFASWRTVSVIRRHTASP
jgi:hypothetical protein